MEVGQKITRAELTEEGWELVKSLAGSCEIYSKGSRRLLWRVKYKTIYSLWDKGRRGR